MRSVRLIAVILAVLVGLTSCSRDPNAAKKHYYESGNKYFDKGQFVQASIQYRNALKRDRKYGPAHYKLALVDMKTGDVSGAVVALRNAVELLPPDQPDHWDAVVKLTEIYIQLANGQKQFMDDADRFTRELLKRDPNSFDAHRLIADLNFQRATQAYKNKRNEEGAQFLETATAEYRKADSIKPGQQPVLMQLAKSLAAAGKFAEAEQIYLGLKQADKTFQPAYSELYRLYMFERKPDLAEQILKQAVQNNPKQFGFLTLLATHYYYMRRRDDMVGVLNQIKSHAKEFQQAYQTVGDFYLRMGDGDSAVREYKEGIAKDPKQKLSYQKSEIEVLMRQGKRTEAAELNAQILKAVPDDNDARGLSASFLLDKGDIAKALAELQAVVTQKPDNPVSRYNLGRAHAARGEYEQARQQFQKAIELRGDYVMARIALAHLQVSRGEFDAALKTSEAILEIDKGNVNARLIESASLMGQKKFGDSRTLLDGMLKTNPGSTDVLFQMGVVNLAEGKYKDAQDAFFRSYQLNPANSRGLMGQVETSMAQNKPDEALKLLQAESDKSPNRLDLLLAMGNTAVRSGKYDFAIQSYDRVLSQLPKNSKEQGDIYLRMGETYRRKGDLASAIQSLQKAREALPQNVVVLSSLALVLDGAGRKPEAKQIYDATLKLDPNNAVVLNNLAYLLAESGGDLDDALTKAQRAKQLMPNINEVSDTLGWIYLKKNLPQNAVDIFKDLVVKQPNQSTYHFHLGMAYSQQGDKMRALEQLREALKYKPAALERDKIQAMIVRLG
jgi:tetratricopeptide (TPR) repeat protein